MTFKRTRPEAIPEHAQNNRQAPDQMAKYAKKHLENYVHDKELKNSITVNSPIPINPPKAKNMDDYFAGLLKDRRNNK